MNYSKIEKSNNLKISEFRNFEIDIPRLKKTVTKSGRLYGKSRKLPSKFQNGRRLTHIFLLLLMVEFPVKITPCAFLSANFELKLLVGHSFQYQRELSSWKWPCWNAKIWCHNEIKRYWWLKVNFNLSDIFIFGNFE